MALTARKVNKYTHTFLTVLSDPCPCKLLYVHVKWPRPVNANDNDQATHSPGRGGITGITIDLHSHFLHT